MPPYMTEKLYKACKSEHKSLYMCEGATHCYSAFHDMSTYFRKVSDFVYTIDHLDDNNDEIK